MVGGWADDRPVSRLGQRGLSTIVSMIVIIVVLSGIGVGTYAVMGGFTHSGPATCQPASSPICATYVNSHDVTLLLPFRSVQQNQAVPFTVSLPSGESPSSYAITYGDGSPTATSGGTTFSHVYTSPGTYLVEAQAKVNGVEHDNVNALTLLTVTPSFGANTQGALPSITGAIVANTTVPLGSRTATAVLQAGQSVTVTGTYTSAPTNPAFIALPPKMVAPGGALTSLPSANNSLTDSVTFSTPGTYEITFVGSATNGTIGTGGTITGGAVFYLNYTWTAFVSAPGSHAGIAGVQVHHSPHPGQIVNYELAPGGALSEDPAIDYETVGAEPIINVYQPLIMYNGSQTGPSPENYIPVLATCVPGSNQCSQLYSGNSLVKGYNYTFVIQGNASFYDPATNAHWGVYPTDVLFSLARTMGFATLPSTESNNGWIIAQALLSSGNVTWDSIHGAYNNTPGNITKSILINDTTDGFCPPAALTGTDHGCVTLVSWGNRHLWPYFLELIADPLGGSIVPCGWFSAPSQAAGIPYWTRGNVTGSGDHPCAPPGSPGWGALPSAIPKTGWDQWEQLGSGAFGSYLGHVQYNMVGSGPYYLSSYLVGSSYGLQANPAYGQNPYCTWKGCEPTASNYARSVAVTWETAATQGETAYIDGIADHASIPSTDFGILLELISQGKAVAISAPTLTIGFDAFNLNFNIGGAQKLSTQTVSVPTDWFSYLGMREFFAHAYPYATVQQTINTRDGVVLGFDYGGAIPQYMANYYPKDIGWPSGDPDTNPADVGGAAWWWAQITNPASPYADPELKGCTASNPCQFPIFGETGSPANDQVLELWISEITSLSGGAIKLNSVDLNFVQIIVNSQFGGPGQSSLPAYGLGWAPDYPDPTDYVGPMYEANNTYTYGDAVMQALLVPQFTQGCTNTVTDYNFFANSTWGDNCQGQAYKAMLYALGVASNNGNLNYRVLLYDIAEKIANKLCLYVYTVQDNQVSSVSSWIDPGSINTNVTIGGGGDVPFFWLTGNDVQYPGST